MKKYLFKLQSRRLYQPAASKGSGVMNRLKSRSQPSFDAKQASALSRGPGTRAQTQRSALAALPTRIQTAWPAATPDAHAHWKL